MAEAKREAAKSLNVKRTRDDVQDEIDRLHTPEVAGSTTARNYREALVSAAKFLRVAVRLREDAVRTTENEKNVQDDTDGGGRSGETRKPDAPKL